MIVIHAGGLALADVSLSTDEGGRDARILVHMRQSSLLLQALDAQKSQVVDSRTFLTEDKTYRVTVALPNSVVGEIHPLCSTGDRLFLDFSATSNLCK